MIFRPYYYFDFGCAAYLFGCGTLGKGTVVDARADDIDACIAFAAATMGFEKRWNPMLTLARDAFIDALADVPPKPAEMERVLAFNRGHEEIETRR
jgi:hypothetical protein